MMRKPSGYALAVLLVLATACGGGSSPATAPGPGGLVAGFLAAEPSPGAHEVTMAEGGRSADVVTVRVSVTGTDDVYGAAVEVFFGSAAVQYVGWSAGSLLEQGGNSPVYNVTVDSSDAGHLIIGASRTGNVPGVNVSGTTTLINLTLRVKQAGSFKLDLANPSLYNSQNPPQTIGGLAWHTGWVTGT